MIRPENIYENLKALCAVPGISGSASENLAAEKIYSMLSEMEYFKEHPENLYRIEVEGDPLGRYSVAGLVELDRKNSGIVSPESEKDAALTPESEYADTTPSETENDMASSPEHEYRESTSPEINNHISQVHNSEITDTVILTGHFDVVGIEEYGKLRDVAFDIESITERISELALDKHSRKDYESGEWIFGRGTADMKYGLSLCLELIRHYTEDEDAAGLKGNLLFLAVPGEETNSEGMLASIPFLKKLSEDKGLKYTAYLLTEPFITEDQEGDPNKYIHFGSCGKVMPMFMSVGDPSHAGEAFLGFDPNLITAGIHMRLQMEPELCDKKYGEVTPPPVCLKMKDLKETYSVTTPLYSLAYYSKNTMDLEPARLIETLRRIAKESMDEAIAMLDEKAERYELLYGETPTRKLYKTEVMTYSELIEELMSNYEEQTSATGNGGKEIFYSEKSNIEAPTVTLEKYSKEFTAKGMELQEAAVMTVRRAIEMLPDKRPMVVLAFIPPFYPNTHIDESFEEDAALVKAAEDTMVYAAEKYGISLKRKEWFVGLSDLCYTGLSSDREFGELFENLVGLGNIYHFPERELKSLHIPGIIMGAWGKDIHKHTERLHRDYNLRILPRLYLRLIENLLCYFA